MNKKHDLSDPEKKIKSLEHQVEDLQKMIQDLISVEKNFQIRESFLKDLLANLPGMAYRCRTNKGWAVDYVSPGSKFLTEYDPFELIGERSLNFQKIIKPSQAEEVWEKIIESLNEKKHYEVEYSILNKSGTEIKVGEKGIGVFNSENELTAYEGFIYRIEESEFFDSESFNTVKNKKKLSYALESIQDGICLIDIVNNEYHFNKKFLEMIGYREDEYLKTLKWFLSIVYYDDLKIVLQKIRSVINSETIQETFNFRIIKKDGELIWVKTTVKVFEVNEDEYPERIIISFVDITEVKNVEQNLSNNLLLLESLLETIPVPVFYKDVEGKYLGCNEAFVNQVGIDKEKLIGHSVFELYSKKLATVYNDADRELFKKGGFQKYEAQIKNKKGDLRDVVFYKNVYTDEDGKQLGLIGVYLDVTEKNKIQKELEDKQQFLESILSRLPMILWKIDKNGIFQFSEGEGLRKLGLIPGEVIGVSAFEMYKEYPDLIDQINRVLAGERFVENSIIDDMVFETYYTPLFDENRNIEGALGVSLDVTLRAHIEEEIKHYIKDLRESKELVEKQVREISQKNKLLKESEEKLIKLNESKDLFFSIIAHDLKNPFNSLIGLSDLLKEVSKKYIVDDDKEIVDIIHNNIKHVYNLLEELLEWAALQLGRSEYKPKLVSLNAPIKNILKLLESECRVKKIQIKNNIENNTQVYVDEKMLETILRNLLSNSIKFTDRSGLITLDAKPDGEKTIISVKDNGIGISKEDVKKLFKIDINYSTTGLEGEKGTGMGLILCKELVEKNNGNIWVESEPNKGSCFLFSLQNSPINGVE